MTNVILKQAKIIDPSSPFHLQTMDLKIENGTITAIEKEITNQYVQHFLTNN